MSDSDYSNFAQSQFVNNILHNSGGGNLEGGAASGHSFLEIDGAFNHLRPPSPEQIPVKIQPAFKSCASLIEATQGAASQFTPQNLGIAGPQMQIPAGFVPPTQKIASLFSSGKGK